MLCEQVDVWGSSLGFVWTISGLLAVGWHTAARLESTVAMQKDGASVVHKFQLLLLFLR